MVSGLTMTRAERHSGQKRKSQIQKNRSQGRILGIDETFQDDDLVSESENLSLEREAGTVCIRHYMRDITLDHFPHFHHFLFSPGLGIFALAIL